MKRNFSWVVLLFAACTAPPPDSWQVVRFDPDDRNLIVAPQEVFASMRAIPLHGPDDVMVDSEGNVICDGGKFFFVDAQHRRCVQIFDEWGAYLSTVSSSGRSDEEYIGITGVQVMQDLVAVYSYHNKAVFYYDLQGRFVRKELLDSAVRNLMIEGDDRWGYLGFSNGQMPERVVRIREGKIVGKYLPSKAAVIPMSERGEVFTACDSVVLVRESLRNEIQAIGKDGRVRPFLQFDFGKYNVPPVYFDQSDPYAAATRLLESDFAVIDRFYLNEAFRIAAVNFQFGSRDAQTVSTVGVCSGGQWRWLKAEKDGPLSLFDASVRGLTPDSELMLLVEPEQVAAFSAAYPELMARVEVSETDPYLVLCKLKN